jgi:type I restriction enzyme S subunit
VSPTVSLGDVATFVRGVTFKPADVTEVGRNRSIACLRTKNVQAEIDLSDVWGIPGSAVKNRAQYLQAGDTLVSSANSWNLVGKCCWVPTLPWPSTFGGFVAVLRGDSARVDPRYLFRWFSSLSVQATVRSFGRQTTNISNLDIGRCLKLPLPLPSVVEQRRIAAILDQADALRAKRCAALAQLDALAESIFIDMFGDPTTNPKGWPIRSLSEVATTTSGGTPNRAVAGFFDGGIPWVKSGELRQGIVTQTEESLSPQGIAESAAKLMPSGTVLVAMYGATAGAVAKLGIMAATNQAVCCIQPTAELDPDYLIHFLRRSSSSLLAKRVGGAQPNLSQEILRAIQLPVPPKGRQGEFGARLSAVDSITSRYRRSLAALDELFTSLHYRAFAGTL